MAANRTIQTRFIPGSTVGIYKESSVSRRLVEENRAPDGAAETTATVGTDGIVTFDPTGYAAGTYLVGGQITHTDTTTVTGSTSVKDSNGNTVPLGTDLVPLTIKVDATEIRESDNTTTVATTDAVYYVDITSLKTAAGATLRAINPSTTLTGDVSVVKNNAPRHRSPLDEGYDYVTFTLTAAEV